MAVSNPETLFASNGRSSSKLANNDRYTVKGIAHVPIWLFHKRLFPFVYLIAQLMPNYFTFSPWMATISGKLPLYLSKNNLARLLARRADGIHLAPFEQGEIGPDLFRAACDMMLEGLVSKRKDSRYRPGPCRDWIKVKNPKSPAMNRTKDAFT